MPLGPGPFLAPFTLMGAREVSAPPGGCVPGGRQDSGREGTSCQGSPGLGSARRGSACSPGPLELQGGSWGPCSSLRSLPGPPSC